MKKLIAVLGVSTALLLAGCEGEVDTGSNTSEELYLETVQEFDMDYGYGGEVVRDPDTGCMYFVTYGDTIHPYYDVDGEVAGCGDFQNP